MEYAIFLDHNRRALLQYRDTGKTRHYVAIVDGSIDCIQLGQKDFSRLKSYVKQTPQHFAETYLKSHLSISRGARAILRGVLSGSGVETEGAGEPRFNSGVVTIEQLSEENNWEPSRCRKFLRKTVDKPGTRWAWNPEEAEKIVVLLREFFDEAMD